MRDIVDEFLRRGHGLPNRAAAELARALMQGDPATFKAGYSRESALLSALEIFPQAERESVERLLDDVPPAEPEFEIERVAGERATHVVRYVRDGRHYFDGLWAASTAEARRIFMEITHELGWVVSDVTIEER